MLKLIHLVQAFQSGVYRSCWVYSWYSVLAGPSALAELLGLHAKENTNVRSNQIA